MMSFMALDGVTSFLRLKDITNNVNVCDTVQLLVGRMGKSWKKPKTPNVFLSFIVC